MLAAVLLNLGAGLVMFLPFFPLREFRASFYWLHGGLGLGLLLLALLLGGPGGAFLGAACAFLALGLFLASTTERPAAALPFFAAAAAAALALLASGSSAGPRVARDAGPVQAAVNPLLSALVTGAAIVAMNVGHWYLVVRALPFRWLRLATALFAGALLLRIADLGLLGWLHGAAYRDRAILQADFVYDVGFFFLQRALFGILGPAILAPLVWRCVEIRSNQAATGILYVVVVLVLVGELASRFLFSRGWPV